MTTDVEPPGNCGCRAACPPFSSRRRRTAATTPMPGCNDGSTMSALPTFWRSEVLIQRDSPRPGGPNDAVDRAPVAADPLGGSGAGAATSGGSGGCNLATIPTSDASRGRRVYSAGPVPLHDPKAPQLDNDVAGLEGVAVREGIARVLAGPAVEGRGARRGAEHPDGVGAGAAVQRAEAVDA